MTKKHGPVPREDAKRFGLACAVSANVYHRVHKYFSASGCRTISQAVLQILLVGLEVLEREG